MDSYKLKNCLIDAVPFINASKKTNTFYFDLFCTLTGVNLQDIVVVLFLNRCRTSVDPIIQ